MVKSKRVLVIDADVKHTDRLKAELLGKGYQVESLPDITEALSGKTHADDVLAILIQKDNSEADPEMKQSIKKLKEKFSHTTMMVMMDKFSIESLRLAVNAGCQEFLAKPVGRDQLLPILDRKRNGGKPRKISMTIKLEATIQDV